MYGTSVQYRVKALTRQSKIAQKKCGLDRRCAPALYCGVKYKYTNSLVPKDQTMYKRIILFIVLLCNISACSSLHSKAVNEASKKTGSYEVADILSDSNDSSAVSRLMAAPFIVAGGVMMAAGGFFLVFHDGENSETESQSEAENGLIGLGLVGGGAILWAIGSAIEG